MKITKRHWYSSPAATINIWFIPTLAYLIQKIGGVEFNEYEWIWWTGTPVLIIIWFFMNFKLVKDNGPT
jgi:hypothetical protein